LLARCDRYVANVCVNAHTIIAHVDRMLYAHTCECRIGRIMSNGQISELYTPRRIRYVSDARSRTLLCARACR
jgi:hypothetical protein